MLTLGPDERKRKIQRSTGHGDDVQTHEPSEVFEEPHLNKWVWAWTICLIDQEHNHNDPPRNQESENETGTPWLRVPTPRYTEYEERKSSNNKHNAAKVHTLQLLQSSPLGTMELLEVCRVVHKDLNYECRACSI